MVTEVHISPDCTMPNRLPSMHCCVGKERKVIAYRWRPANSDQLTTIEIAPTEIEIVYLEEK